MSKGCMWLSNGLYIETYTKKDFNSPISNDLALKSCCRILSPTDGADSTFAYEQFEKNRLDPNWNFDNLKESACSKCYKEEQRQGSSMRTRSPAFADDGKVKSLQLTFSSFCNLKCKYCSSANSTSWNEDVPYSEGTMHIEMTKEETFDHEAKVLNFLEKIDLSGLRYIGIFGGEPFMARRFGEFMQLLDKKAKPGLMGLQINTNATIFPKPKIMDILKQFRKVDLRLSNESVGELSEYIRNGSKWEDFEKNTHKWLEASVGNGIDVKVHAAHNVWSVNKAESFYNWTQSIGIPVFNASTPTPIYSNIASVLTDTQLKECSDIIDMMPDSKMKSYLYNMVTTGANNDHDDALSKFKQFTRLFDHRTPYTLQQVNPQLYAWTHNQ